MKVPSEGAFPVEVVPQGSSQVEEVEVLCGIINGDVAD